jgi:hypothetical protein
MSSIVFTAIQTGFRQLKEKGCWSITLHTQEIELEQAMRLSEFTSDMVKVLMSDNNITDVARGSVEKLPISNNEKYTPSQRLRFAIEDLAKRRGHDDTEDFYQSYMVKLINHVNDL